MKNLLILLLAFLLMAASPRVVEVETPKMPLLAATLYFPFGAATEAQGQRGATLAVFEWLESGTRRLTAEQIGDGFLASGARYVYNVDIHYSTVTIEAPEAYFLAGWNLMMEVLREPRLTEVDLKEVTKKHVTAKRARLTNTLGVAKDLAYAAVYAGSPEGASPFGDEQDISALTVEKATTYYQETLAQGPSILLVSRSMPSAIRRNVEKSLAGWASPATARRPVSSSIPGKSLIIVERPGSTQAYVAFAKRGPGYFDKDRPYSAIATEILGGNGTGGDSLLFKELRSKQGLTYHASMQTWRRPDRDMIVGLTFGANENIPKLVSEYLRIWDGFAESANFSQQTLVSAKRRIDGKVSRENATVYDAMMRAVQLTVAGDSKDVTRSDIKQDRYLAAKKKVVGSRWLDRTCLRGFQGCEGWTPFGPWPRNESEHCSREC